MINILNIPLFPLLFSLETLCRCSDVMVQIYVRYFITLLLTQFIRRMKYFEIIINRQVYM